MVKVFFGLICFWASFAYGEVWSLSKLLEKSNTHSLILLEAESEYLKSELDLSSSSSKFLPTLYFESSLIAQRPEWESNGAFVLSQSIYNNGLNWRLFEKAKLSHEKARFELSMAKENLAYELLLAYAEASLLNRRWVATERKLGLLENQFNLVQRQYRQGLKTQRDYQVLEAELERSKLSLEDIGFQRSKALSNIATLVGLEEVKDSPPEIVNWTGEWILNQQIWLQDKNSITAQNEIYVSQINEKVLQLDYDEARRQFFPQLNLEAKLSYGADLWPNTYSDSWRASVGLNLKWVLWDWGLTSNEVKKSRANLILAERRTQQQLLSLSSDVNVIRKNHERQKKGLALRKKIRDLEEKSFSSIEREYREGKLGYLELLTALERDIQAELSFEEEAFAYLKTLAELKKYEGTLYDTIQKL